MMNSYINLNFYEQIKHYCKIKKKKPRKKVIKWHRFSEQFQNKLSFAQVNQVIILELVGASKNQYRTFFPCIEYKRKDHQIINVFCSDKLML